jgi:DNA repair photolyase
MTVQKDNPDNVMRGRGTSSKVGPRYMENTTVTIDDGWDTIEESPHQLTTTVTVEHPKNIITYNQSPDIPFEASINAYRGCEHGCIYCYARPTHAWQDLSPGIDFETRLFAKPDAADLLRAEISKKNYHCTPRALGTNTDPYQPIEREWKITRQILEVLHEFRHPLTIVTKSSLVERDLDLLSDMAQSGLVQIFVSVTTLDRTLARKMEPRAAAPQRRLQTIQRLAEAGIPTGVMFAPVIPVLNDAEMETILSQASQAGAGSAGYVVLRLPHELKTLFREWLQTHYPLKAGHVMNRVRDIRGGKEYDSDFSSRMRGTGIYAALIDQRFRAICERLGLNRTRVELDTSAFLRKGKQKNQLELF